MITSKKHQLPFVLDPIMADKGSMYAQLTPQHLSAMRLLAQAAQLILPNVTEACLLADVPYFGRPIAERIWRGYCLS
ncbi:bifunctional hydroxymethylpyrimidine kinase/phosphomethylpyrimidine kinase [Streptococcus equi]|uniref:bifunctional hydroxymethylpyrimidine kinase/phosphomethylpyrimidine kinase n=1 Tax=Streptococcus equi TaxID=1336 RepID=UPI001E5D56DE|nr:bifunctional hydroxymethylpyrimidine kinase/phosphomethylpyrimidine kinase [Streptococcus equi]